jgi:hypothetical protein
MKRKEKDRHTDTTVVFIYRILYNEFKHNILALVAKANKGSNNTRDYVHIYLKPTLYMCWVLFSFQIGVFKTPQKEFNDNFLMPNLDLQHVVDYDYY